MSKVLGKVIQGTIKDIDLWMNLVHNVSPGFPGLETEDLLKEHKDTVLRFMREGRALCVKENEGHSIVGVLLYSKKHNRICFLAVSPDFRRQGIASMLLEEAIRCLDRSCPIIVSTFREEDPKGAAPRALYRKFGFIEGNLTEEFGYPNQVFILHPSIS